MTFSSSTVVNGGAAKPNFNAAIVGLLLFLAGVPGLPAIFLLASIAMGPPSDGSPHAFVNMLHFTTPMPVVVHGSAGMLFFITMPFQFSTRLRINYNRWHRSAGCLAIISGYFLAFSAPWMHQVFSPDSGLPRYSGLLTMSVGMIISFSLSLHSILSRNVKQHRAWMMRAVAITLGPVSPLLFEIPIYLIWGGLDNVYPGLSLLESSYARWFGMAINLAIIECLLFRESASTAIVGSQATAEIAR